MSLTNLEKETIILFNEGEGEARIETFNARLLGQLRKIEKCEGVRCEESKKGYGVYIVPKTMIKIIAPQRRPVLTDEQRKAVNERLKLAREKASQNQF